MATEINSLSSLNKSSEHVAKRDQFLVSPSIVEIEDGYNIRTAFDPEYWERDATKAYVRSLADAYKAIYGETAKKDGAKGDIDPIVVVVRDGRVILRGGEHRLRGALLAMSEDPTITKIEARQFRGGRLDELLYLEKSNNQKNTTQLQKAVLYKRLIDEGMSMTQIANEFDRSHEHVRQSLILLDMPEQLIKMIVTKDVSASTALKCFQAHGDKAPDVLLSAMASAKAASTGSNANSATPVAAVTTKNAIKAEKKSDAPAVSDATAGGERKGNETATIASGVKTDDGNEATEQAVEAPAKKQGKFARITEAVLKKAANKKEDMIPAYKSAFELVAAKIGDDYDNVPDTLTITLSKVELSTLLLLKKKLTDTPATELQEDQLNLL